MMGNAHRSNWAKEHHAVVDTYHSTRKASIVRVLCSLGLIERADGDGDGKSNVTSENNLLARAEVRRR
jgi:hypothetical protein